jgi:hypothetical protein
MPQKERVLKRKIVINLINPPNFQYQLHYINVSHSIYISIPSYIDVGINR